MKTKQTIKLGISSCLLGDNVRYDGGHKLDHYLRDTLGQFVEWAPVCPEVESGLPAPREPMQLVKGAGSPRLVTVRTGVDRTRALSRWSRGKLRRLEHEDICGFVFKARSPSCGVRDAKLFSFSGSVIGKGAGVFASEVSTRFPSLPLEDEGRMREPGLGQNFIERAFVYQRWLGLKADGGTIRGLIAFHAEHTLLIMSHSIKHLRQLGALVSNTKKYKQPDLFERYSRVLMQGLRLSSTIKKHTNVLQHMAGYFKQQCSSGEKRELQDAINRFHKEQVPLAVPITLIKHLVRKYNVSYLRQQRYLNPHPIEGMLQGPYTR